VPCRDDGQVLDFAHRRAGCLHPVAAAGRYPSASAVLQQGVDLLRRQMEADEADVAALRAILSERLEGPFISAEEMRARTEAMIARKRRDGPG
jgi:antitoxin ParD1/3/4